MATCPNCVAQILPESEQCSACGAMFGEEAAWRPVAQSPEVERQLRERLAAEAASREAAAAAVEIPAAVAEVRYPVEFTAKGGEYFRIWIVNLALTIATLGLYSPWAKVRKKRYFYAHTRVDGDSFEYRGNPIAILKGRLVALGMAGTFYGALNFYPSLLWGLVPAALAVAPWLIVRSFAFNAYNTAYRNVRMHFRGSYGGCLRVLFLYGLLTLITFGLGLFFLRVRMTEFVIRNHSFGATPFRLLVDDLKPIFFGIWGRMIGLGFLLGIGVGILSAVLGGSTARSAGPPIVATLALYFGYLVIFAFNRARIANATWNNTAAGSLRFECTLRARDIMMLYLTNILAIVFTLGLATPWAAVRMMRYRASKIVLIAAGGIDSFVQVESSQVGASGEEVVELMDFDFSI
jgi:uncharacterized membrane protein YjgN (DUF898 family)